jgi:hypothetical protein
MVVTTTIRMKTDELWEKGPDENRSGRTESKRRTSIKSHIDEEHNSLPHCEKVQNEPAPHQLLRSLAGSNVTLNQCLFLSVPAAWGQLCVGVPAEDFSSPCNSGFPATIQVYFRLVEGEVIRPILSIRSSGNH